MNSIKAALAETNVDFQIVLSPETKAQGLPGIVEATNFLVQKCLDENYDRLWIVEADVEVSKHSLVKLLCDADINLGIYPNHRPNKLLMMTGYFKVNFNRVKPEVKSVFDINKLKGKIFTEMVWAGIGCSLTKRNVLQKIRFIYDPREYSQKVGVHDQLFLFDAQQIGFNVLIHGDAICGHLPEWSLQKLEELLDGC